MRLFLLNKSLPRWIVLLLDQVIISWAFFIAVYLIQLANIGRIFMGHLPVYQGVYCLVALGVFYLLRLHAGLMRYSNTSDLYRIFTAIAVATLTYGIAVELFVRPLLPVPYLNVVVVLIVNFFISSTLLVMSRMAAKGVFLYVKRTATGEKETYLIYGSNGHAVLIKNALETSGLGKYVVAGFVDDSSNKVNKHIHQVKVYHVREIESLHKRVKIDKLIIMSEDLKSEVRKRAIEKCIELGIKVLTVPPTEQWMSGELRMNQMRDLRIEDLLQRPPIVIENEKIAGELCGKRVLVTGGAGSIGSEIVRQVLGFGPEMVIICDQAESPLHELQLEIEETYPGANLKLCIADIQNFNRMYALFSEYTPHIVYHAAAYKHVPMMENNPSEAILTNVLGSKNLADLAMTFDVEKFVMISTDKAVNPTNIMGASKRIAEIYTQSLYSVSVTADADTVALPQTKFITTRFGNVLGSNGSVIPRFRSQIEKGGPITVTHPDITRYFMTIPEAVQLVLEAGTMGEGGEIFIFDMGEPVKIVDLARKMIKLAGFVPEVDIPITYSGLRPGEKLFEELLNQEEQTIPTHHHKIKISKVRKYPYDQVLSDITELITLNKEGNDMQVVRQMKKIVPEFKSKNSKYEVLDSVSEETSEAQ